MAILPVIVVVRRPTDQDSCRAVSPVYSLFLRPSHIKIEKTYYCSQSDGGQFNCVQMAGPNLRLTTAVVLCSIRHIRERVVLCTMHGILQ